MQKLGKPLRTRSAKKGLGVWGLGFRVLGLRVLGLRILGFRVLGFWGLGLRGLGFMERSQPAAGSLQEPVLS